MIQFFLSENSQSFDLLILPVFEEENLEKDLKAHAPLLGETFLHMLGQKDFAAKFLDIGLVYSGSKEARRIVLLGLGKKEHLTLRKWKQALGTAIIFAQGKKATAIGLLISAPILKKFGVEVLSKESTLAVIVSSYAYDQYKSKETKVSYVEQFSFVGRLVGLEKKEFQTGIKQGQILGESINWVRDLGNTPPSVMNPELLAHEATQLAKSGVKVKILSLPQIEKLGMGCLLGVAKGSLHEPKFIILEYLKGKQKEAPTVLVGKGITFDSGGLSLKPWEYMVDMKFDMLGGATVLGIVKAVSEMKLKKNLIGLIPCCENMPSGTAYRPDDVLMAMNGTTVLVENTDAEGRLILADALCYAARYAPKEVIDFATLTGACLVALGNERSGLFSQEETLVEGLLKSAESVGEQLWRLPLGEEYSEAVKSELADLRNSGGVGGSRFAGASTAAAFLEYFTSYPWAHIDLSCSYYGGKGKPWIRGGANGFGIQTVLEYLQKQK